MTMGDRIKYLRLKANLTQEELGAKVGVNKAAINKYETGTVENLKRSMIEKLAIALDTTPTYIMGWEEEKPAASGELSEKDVRLLNWFRSLPEGKQQAILTAQDAPEGLV